MTKKAWVALGYDEGTWKHRKLLLETLKKHLPFDSLLDVGCAHGPDLALIHSAMPQIALSGFDITKEDVADGKTRIPLANLWVADIREELPRTPDKSYDVVFTNGVMMYQDKPLLKELLRIAKKTVFMSERTPGEHFTQYLQEECGITPKVTRITKDIRDSWGDDGFIYEITL